MIKILREWDLGLDADHLLRGQGADPAIIRARQPGLVETADWALAEGLPLLDPVVMVRELSVIGVRHERLLLEGGKYLSGPLVIQHIGSAEKVVILLCSIGSLLESIASEVMKSDVLKGLALDGLGSAAVEELAVQACRSIEEQSKEMGQKVSIPLSPGMVGWDVDPAQRQVFDLIDGSTIGVKLNHSLMMYPSKSLTQVLGIGKDLQNQGRPCDYCNLKETCRYQDHYV